MGGGRPKGCICLGVYEDDYSILTKGCPVHDPKSKSDGVLLTKAIKKIEDERDELRAKAKEADEDGLIGWGTQYGFRSDGLDRALTILKVALGQDGAR